MAKLAALKAWELMVVLLAVATAAGLAVSGLVWVMWTIRPLLATYRVARCRIPGATRSESIVAARLAGPRMARLLIVFA